MNVNEESVFAAALEKQDPQEQAAFLDRACAGDPDLRKNVESLLSAYDAGQFLEAPAAAPAATVDEPIHEGPGTIIGPYKLLEQIGEGGFGIVFMAEQQHPVRRKVALKLLKPGMDTRQVIARFEAERQALALMDHPHIARVFDGGETVRGRPYFVMELVKGIPITDYCDQGQLTPKDRLGLFVSVCQAVQHAHQKGIIHRDLKPSNVLVTVHDGVPVVKVIDFGIAKATGQQLTDKTLFTNFAQLIGTPLYMSPEQAALSGLDMDTRSDIYSLGVLLYELLTGTTPLEKERFREAGYNEVCRIIREEEPPSPSARLSTLGQAATAISTQRQSDPKRLSQLCRGELDWIVMKCLEKDRNRRYETANAFAADVQRYLHDEPVQACPPSAAYRLKKFLRRNKRPVLAAALVLVALVGGIIGTTWSMLRATDAEAYALSQANQKEKALTAARQNERDARGQLFQALLHQARALRHGGSVGARSQSLKVLDEAAALVPTLGLTSDQVLELRNEAIACLNQTNLTLDRQWTVFRPTSRGLGFDTALRRYARGDHVRGKQGDISVRRVEDDREVVRLPGAVNLSDDHTFFKFSPDGTRLAVRNSAGPGLLRVTVWDLVRRQSIFTISGATDFDFHPWGRRAAAVLADGSIRLYDPSTGKQDGTLLPDLKGYSPFLCFNAQGTKLAVASDGNPEVQVWDTATSALEKRVKLPGGIWYALAWHPGGRLLAAGAGKRIYLHDLDMIRTTVLSGHQADITHLAFNPAGDLLASLAWDATARLWDARTGRQLLWMPASPRPGPQFSGDGQRLAIRYGRTAEVSKIDRSAEYRAFPSPLGVNRGPGDPLQFSADGRLLCVAGEKGIQFWDTGTREASGLLPPPGFRSVLYDRSGKHLITTSSRGVHLWPVSRGRKAGAVCLRIGPPQALAATEIANAHFAALSLDGRTLVVTTGDHRAAVLDVPARKLRVRLTGQKNLIFVAISPDGRWVASASGWGEETVVWDAKTGKRVKSWPHFPGLSGRATFSPDGKWLVTTVGPDYRLTETRSWQLRRILPKEDSGEIPGPAVFSDDGKVLAVADAPDKVKLLDPNTGREYATLSVPGGLGLGSLCFSPGGSRLAVNTADGLVHVWNLRCIRQRLAAMNLDWDLPPLPAPPQGDADAPVRLDMDLGELAPVRLSLADNRRTLKTNPNDAVACNNLAWIYATGPADLRNPEEALRLARNAVGLAPNKHEYLNTLGVAYYRLGQWEEAVAALQDAVKANGGKATAFDLFFLAMCHQDLGQRENARDCYGRANAWWQAQTNVSPQWEAELKAFHTEAATRLGLRTPAPPSQRGRKGPAANRGRKENSGR
jgi:serine/threonine protein kinase/WD40 repeat protein